MSCSKREDVISSSIENDELHRLLYRALNDIQAVFNNSITQLPSKEFRAEGVSLPPNVRIKELNSFKFITIFNKPTARGLYEPFSRKIFLHQGKWCWKTVLHETLHSVSNFCLEPNINIALKNKWLNDGLTEFLTGFILFNTDLECFDAWKNKDFEDFCPVSYSPEVRFWGTFCQFIPITVPVKFYFLNPSLTWREVYHRFLDDIRLEIPNFPDVLSRGNILKISAFRKACENHFGKVFRKIEISRIKSLDFAKLCY